MAQDSAENEPALRNGWWIDICEKHGKCCFNSVVNGCEKCAFEAYEQIRPRPRLVARPKEDTLCLVYTDRKTVHLATYNPLSSASWTDDRGSSLNGVTHWLPISEKLVDQWYHIPNE